MSDLDAGAVLELAQACAGLPELERALVPALLASVGADVGYLCLAANGTASGAGAGFATSLAPDAPVRGRHAGELAPVLRAAARDGIALDVDVLGESTVRSSRYFSEFVRPQGGGETLFAVPRLRGWAAGCLLLGRGGGGRRFGPRALGRLEPLLPAIAAAAAVVTRAATEATPRPTLSPREAEIVDYLALGYRSAEIAGALGTSVHTVRNQVARLMGRLGAATRAELLAVAWPRRA
jgi:DNA-binding CsgD family transcriptional regulator